LRKLSLVLILGLFAKINAQPLQDLNSAQNNTISTNLNSLNLKNEFDFYAKTVSKKDDNISSNEPVLLFSKDYLIKANKANYNEKSKDLELSGDVSILREDKESLKACYARLNLNTNEASFKNFFFANTDMEVWFQSEQSDLNDNVFIGKNSVVSSCDVENPDWQIKFSQGELDRAKKFLHLYNARLYVKEVPVMYLPYFGFSVDTSRQSGLLLPKLEFNRTDKFYYEQPIYWVISNNADLEFSPQLRVQRGFGAYSSLRFVDSLSSSGELNLGAFRERNSFFQKEDLKNKTHKGVELKYSREDLTKSLAGLDEGFSEGLFIDAIYLNDIDYLNLGRRNFKDVTSLVTSKLNYFLADENNYYAAYAKYYIDTSKLSNADTLQEYPSFQYHHFLSSIFNNHLQYSFDVNFHRYHRTQGMYANTMDFNLPLSYHTKFFNDYLNFNFTEILNGSLINYTKNPSKDKEHIFRNYHNFSLYTDLSKAYSGFLHSINLGFNYFLVGAKSGQITQDFLSIEDPYENASMKFVQYFYDKNGKKRLKHQFSSDYNVDLSKLQGFSNKLEYFFNENLSLSNDVIYSYTQKRFTKVVSSMTMSLERFNASLTHAYLNDKELLERKYSFISSQFDYTLNANYKLFSGAYFDTQQAHLNAWEAGFSYQRQCWNYSLMYKERIDPQLSSRGIKAKNKSGVYLAFNFYPLGGVGYDFSLTENESAVSEF